MRVMGAANAVVSAVLRSPLQGLLSGSTCLVQYTGQRSHDQFTTPTRYARHDDDVVILVGRAPGKTWCRNLRGERDVDVLLRCRWHEMAARAVVGADDPDATATLLAAYLDRYPKATSRTRWERRCILGKRSGDGVVPTAMTSSARCLGRGHHRPLTSTRSSAAATPPWSCPVSRAAAWAQPLL